jgi:uncharacterized protein (UPF0548 family)
VITLRAPTADQLAAFLASQRDAALSYPEVGATRSGTLPVGYEVDWKIEQVGRNWEAARRALAGWEIHEAAGVRVVPSESAREGLTVALVVKAGAYMTSACRVVYTIDEPERFGFAYGTLADHPVAGEEQFLLSLGPEGAVSFSLLAFSRPQSLLFRMASPIARRKQLALGNAYIAAMRDLAAAR